MTAQRVGRRAFGNYSKCTIEKYTQSLVETSVNNKSITVSDRRRPHTAINTNSISLFVGCGVTFTYIERIGLHQAYALPVAWCKYKIQGPITIYAGSYKEMVCEQNPDRDSKAISVIFQNWVTRSLPLSPYQQCKTLQEPRCHLNKEIGSIESGFHAPIRPNKESDTKEYKHTHKHGPLFQRSTIPTVPRVRVSRVSRVRV